MFTTEKIPLILPCILQKRLKMNDSLGKAYFQGICTAVCDTGLCVYPWGKPTIHNTKWKKNFDSLTSPSEPDTKK